MSPSRPPSPRGEVRFDERAEKALFNPASPAEALRDEGGRARGDRDRRSSPRRADGDQAESDSDRGHRGDQYKGKKGKVKGRGKKGKGRTGKGGGARLVSNPFHFWNLRQQRRKDKGGGKKRG